VAVVGVTVGVAVVGAAVGAEVVGDEEPLQGPAEDQTNFSFRDGERSNLLYISQATAVPE
jgi:hypothetical protein